MDVPTLEMLHRAGIHHDQRGMDDGPGIHQRARQRVAARVHRRIGARDHRQRRVALPSRIDAGWQAHGTDRHADFAHGELSRQVRQGAGLRPGDPGARAVGANGARHDEAAEGAGREEDDLAVLEVRRHRLGDVVLRARRRRHDDQLDAGDCRADVGARTSDRHLAPTSLVDEDDRARVDHRRERRRVAAPEADLVARLGEVGGGGVAAVAAPENGDVHGHGDP